MTAGSFLFGGETNSKFRLRLDVPAVRAEISNKLIEGRVGLFVNFFDFDRADRMLHDQHRMIWRAKSFLLGFCQGTKAWVISVIAKRPRF